MIDLWLHLTRSHTFPGADAAVVVTKEWQSTYGQGTANGGVTVLPPCCSRCCDSGTWPSPASVTATCKGTSCYSNLEEAAKNCQREGAGEAPQNHVLAAGQRWQGLKQRPRAASPEGSSRPARMTGKEENSSCIGWGINWELRDTQGGKEEEDWLGNAHKTGKINGISRQEWVLTVITTLTFMVSG